MGTIDWVNFRCYLQQQNNIQFEVIVCVSVSSNNKLKIWNQVNSATICNFSSRNKLLYRSQTSYWFRPLICYVFGHDISNKNHCSVLKSFVSVCEIFVEIY